jgi:type I restriction enzyme S subunit
LKISNLTQQDWIIDFETKKEFIDEETSKRFPQTILESGDLVMAVRGATIGKTAYVSKEYVGFNINANLLRMKPNQKILDGKFFWYFMKSQTGQNQFQQLVTSTAKQTITVPKLKTIEVPVPSLDEQREIVSYLDGLQIQLEQLRNLQDESQSELDALMPSVLDKAFKGEL